MLFSRFKNVRFFFSFFFFERERKRGVWPKRSGIAKKIQNTKKKARQGIGFGLAAVHRPQRLE
jgi:hypothetical protein